MNKDNYEVYVVEIGRRDGKRYADRHPLNVPLDHATGRLEDLSDLQLREAAHDLQVEQQRRIEVAARRQIVASKCGGYDPFTSQSRTVAVVEVTEEREVLTVSEVDPQVQQEIAVKCEGYDPFASQHRRS